MRLTDRIQEWKKRYSNDDELMADVLKYDDVDYEEDEEG